MISVYKYLVVLFVVQCIPVIIECVYLKQTCSDNSQCPENSACVVSSCEDEALVCQCDLGYFPDESFTKCLQVKKLGEKCNETTTCMGSAMKCFREECICITNFEPTEDHASCRPSMGLGHILYAGLGDPCSGQRICDNPSELVCLAGHCRCRPGFRRRTWEELMLQPNGPLKCVRKGEVVKPLCHRRVHSEL